MRPDVVGLQGSNGISAVDSGIGAACSDIAATNAEIAERLTAFVTLRSDLSFSGDAGRDMAHSLVQYPAMMVPKMQGGLIDCIRGRGQHLTVVDPFMGSGTVLVEAQRRGLPFIGFDINPYAVLIAMAKAEHYTSDILVGVCREIGEKLAKRESIGSRPSFPQKWFRNDVAADLALIHRAISSFSSASARRLMWACLGEVARVSSNSRTSTFKLHIRPQEEIERSIDAVAIFMAVFRRACKLLSEEVASYPERMNSLVETRLCDSMVAQRRRNIADLLVSSPPYGDNQTTVPYGQFSYLPLHWIDLNDIPSADASAIRNTHALDTSSLGGRRLGVDSLRESLEERSPSLAKYLSSISVFERADRRRRVLAFVRDLDTASQHCCDMVKPGGCMIWTVGNRKVGGATVPLSSIIQELFEARGCTHIKTLNRRIPAKRMALKNSIAETMRSEFVVVLRNG